MEKDIIKFQDFEKNLESLKQKKETGSNINESGNIGGGAMVEWMSGVENSLESILKTLTEFKKRIKDLEDENR